ncbi:MAG: hypothetical protein QXR39_09340 [Candidatus Methanomethylicia archaeon]
MKLTLAYTILFFGALIIIMYAFMQMFQPAILPPPPNISTNDFSLNSISKWLGIPSSISLWVFTIPTFILQYIAYPFGLIARMIYDAGLYVIWVGSSIGAILGIFPPIITYIGLSLFTIMIILAIMRSIKIFGGGIE